MSQIHLSLLVIVGSQRICNHQVKMSKCQYVNMCTDIIAPSGTDYVKMSKCQNVNSVNDIMLYHAQFFPASNVKCQNVNMCNDIRLSGSAFICILCQNVNMINLCSDT